MALGVYSEKRKSKSEKGKRQDLRGKWESAKRKAVQPRETFLGLALARRLFCGFLSRVATPEFRERLRPKHR